MLLLAIKLFIVNGSKRVSGKKVARPFGVQ